jgi:small conductance mechanosensitive channel
MHDVRADARRVRATRRERVSSTPARVAAPLLAAVLVVGATAYGTTVLGFPWTVVAASTATVALAGGCIAHRTAGNVFAGLLLLLVRPYAPGERVRLRLAEPIGVVDGELVRVGLANTTICSGKGLLTVPNSRLLHASPDLGPYTETSTRA